MRYGLSCWRTGTFRAGLLTAGLSITVLGCHAKKSSQGGTETAQPAGTLAIKGAAAVAAVCTRQSYATAKTGLIAGETGLREDVFELRDPVSYTIIPYRLSETVHLEALLRQAAAAPGRPEAQTKCMQDFADHLKTLSDPLVEQANDEKTVDGLAFKDAEKEAQQEIDTEQQIEKIEKSSQ